MELAVWKAIFAGILLVISLVGGFLPRKVSSLSQVATHVTFAFAGGLLASLAIVHMLADASDDLVDVGRSVAKGLTGKDDAEFPMGNALFLIGFFFICFLETVLHHKLGGHAEHHSFVGDSIVETDPEKEAANAGGWASFVGLSVHSTLEGIAAGAGNDLSQEFFVMFAIILHKGFAAFAVSSANSALLRTGRRRIWIAQVIFFALTGSLGVVFGLVAGAAAKGAGQAVIVAFAGGTLFSVAINEMLMPAFADSRKLGCKLFAAGSSMLIMALLAVWS